MSIKNLEVFEHNLSIQPSIPAWISEAGYFISIGFVGFDDPPVVYTSTNGKEWTEHTTNLSSDVEMTGGGLKPVFYVDGKLRKLALYQDKPRMYEADPSDPGNWTATGPAFSDVDRILGHDYSPKLNRYILIYTPETFGEDEKIGYSDDLGASWNIEGVFGDMSLESFKQLDWIPDGHTGEGLFFGIIDNPSSDSSDFTYNGVHFSADGINWESHRGIDPADFSTSLAQDLFVFDGNKYLMAISETGTGGVDAEAVSTDGVNWSIEDIFPIDAYTTLLGGRYGDEIVIHIDSGDDFDNTEILAGPDIDSLEFFKTPQIEGEGERINGLARSDDGTYVGTFDDTYIYVSSAPITPEFWTRLKGVSEVIPGNRGVEG